PAARRDQPAGRLRRPRGIRQRPGPDGGRGPARPGRPRSRRAHPLRPVVLAAHSASWLAPGRPLAALPSLLAPSALLRRAGVARQENSAAALREPGPAP